MGAVSKETVEALVSLIAGELSKNNYVVVEGDENIANLDKVLKTLGLQAKKMLVESANSNANIDAIVNSDSNVIITNYYNYEDATTEYEQDAHTALIDDMRNQPEKKFILCATKPVDMRAFDSIVPF